jgi:hypothetical protein
MESRKRARTDSAAPSLAPAVAARVVKPSGGPKKSAVSKLPSKELKTTAAQKPVPPPTRPVFLDRHAERPAYLDIYVPPPWYAKNFMETFSREGHRKQQEHLKAYRVREAAKKEWEESLRNHPLRAQKRKLEEDAAAVEERPAESQKMASTGPATEEAANLDNILLNLAENGLTGSQGAKRKADDAAQDEERPSKLPKLTPTTAPAVPATKPEQAPAPVAPFSLSQPESQPKSAENDIPQPKQQPQLAPEVVEPVPPKRKMALAEYARERAAKRDAEKEAAKGEVAEAPKKEKTPVDENDKSKQDYLSALDKLLQDAAATAIKPPW